MIVSELDYAYYQEAENSIEGFVATYKEIKNDYSLARYARQMRWNIDIDTSDFGALCFLMAVADIKKGYDEFDHTLLIRYKDDFVVFLAELNMLGDGDAGAQINYFNYELYLDKFYETFQGFLDDVKFHDGVFDMDYKSTFLLESFLRKAGREDLAFRYLSGLASIWLQTIRCNGDTMSPEEQVFMDRIMQKVRSGLNDYTSSLGASIPEEDHISEEYYNASFEISKQFDEFHTRVSMSSGVRSGLPKLQWNTQDTDYNKLLNLVFIRDLIICLRKLGHDFNLRKKESLPIFFCINYLAAHDVMDNMSYQALSYLIDQLGPTVEGMQESINEESQFFVGSNEYDFGIVSLLQKCGETGLITSYVNIIYRLSSLISKADDNVTEQEKQWLARIFENASIKHQDSSASSSATIDSKVLNSVQNANAEPEINPIDKLNSLIGLYQVKTDITSLSNLVYIQGIRTKRGMKTTPISYHCVFTGNPGTGKTTVARIVADIYKKLGIIKSGHLVETDRSGLVADYVGQTATKTNAIIDSALDGVLFIDEAYSLVQGGSSDYGKEAISTLLKRMEDDRSRLVVILAGYTKEMGDFINSNSGLQSRFSRYIEFPDYTEEELLKIFYRNLKENDCVMSDEAEQKVKEYIWHSVATKNKNFGNARFVRNFFERILTQQANRVAMLNHISVDILSKIELSDVENAIG